MSELENVYGDIQRANPARDYTRLPDPPPAAEEEGEPGDDAASENGNFPSALRERSVRKEKSGEEPPPFALLSQVLDETPEEPKWLLDGFLAPGAVTLLAGRPKVGKSTFLFALFHALATGQPFIGLETSQSGILLLTEERPDTIAEKARAFGLADMNTHVLMRYQARAMPWPDIVRHSIRHARKHGLTVLAIDTWDKWAGLRGDAENSSGAVTEALEPLLYAAAGGLAVAVSTHQRKSGGEVGEAVRGSNALTGGVDIVVELERLSESVDASTHSRVLRSLSRFATTPEELVIELGDGGYEARGDTVALKADLERERLLSVLAGLTEPATAVKLADESGLPESTCRKRANQLTERGSLVREGEGGKGDPHRWRLAEDSFRTADSLGGKNENGDLL